MYGLRLFIVVLQELHCVMNSLRVGMIRVRGCYHFTKFHCSIPSVFPGFFCTRTTLFTTMFTVSIFGVFIEWYVCIYQGLVVV